MTFDQQMQGSSPEYQQILTVLFAQNTNVKLGLSRIEELLKLTGFKKSSMCVIQVVGTNGKGSTVAFMESMLRENGISCGLFTSPHLCTARERIRINGEIISEADFIQAARQIWELGQGMKENPSFFECVLAMALWLFERAQVQVAILEAGIGGRLDATSAVGAEILGVSMIDLDHQKILGESIEAIAREKIHAARAHQTVITTYQQRSVQAIIEEARENIGFRLLKAEPTSLSLGLFGHHQKYNAGLALACLKELNLCLDEHKTHEGLKKVCWPGRFELVSQEPSILLDGAHNPSGIKTLTKALHSHKELSKKPVALVFGSLESPNTREKIALLLKDLKISSVYLHRPNNNRAEGIEELRRLFKEEGYKEENLHTFADWPALIKEAKKKDEVVLVCGSLYTVGEARSAILGIPQDILQPNF